ncbi:MAG: hypothetical protein JWM98_156 [Thermoleophilia bacterium]|nr:hypothetical protein [Thermoleophilia bacterium]
MRKVRKIAAIGMCGLVLGGTMSVLAAPGAEGRIYSTCDQRIDNMETQAAKDYKKGKITKAQYDAVLAEVAYHRQLWGC